MIKEFTVPLLEGQESSGPTRMRIFPHSEIPIEIGSLERKAFAYVSGWDVLLDNEGYGVIYRIATKDVIDDEGQKAMLVLYFANPVAKQGLTMSMEMAIKKYEDLGKAMKTFTLHAQQKYGGNIITINQEPPKWMKEELEGILKK